MNSQSKGKRWEREIVKIFNKKFNTDKFRRVPASGGFVKKDERQTLDKGVANALVGDLIVPENFKFTIEAKHYNDFNFWDLLNFETENNIDKWLLQAQADAISINKSFLLIIKIDRKKPFVVFNVKDFNIKIYDLIYKEQFGFLRFDKFLKLNNELFYE